MVGEAGAVGEAGVSGEDLGEGGGDGDGASGAIAGEERGGSVGWGETKKFEEESSEEGPEKVSKEGGEEREVEATEPVEIDPTRRGAIERRLEVRERERFSAEEESMTE
jgi:hypothetical protein